MKREKVTKQDHLDRDQILEWMFKMLIVSRINASTSAYRGKLVAISTPPDTDFWVTERPTSKEQLIRELLSIGWEKEDVDDVLGKVNKSEDGVGVINIPGIE